MQKYANRRTFLKSVGQGTLLATVGPSVAEQIGLPLGAAWTCARGDDGPNAKRLDFGNLEPLVRMMQDTPHSRIQSAIIDRMREGVSMKDLIAAGALANARTFGGQDYIGFHTFMALGPALKMSALMRSSEAPLPVLKVLFRNTHRIQELGGRDSEILHACEDTMSRWASHAAETSFEMGTSTHAKLRSLVCEKHVDRAEQVFQRMVARDSRGAMQALLPIVQENPEVHRVVLPYRAWDMLDIVGKEHAMTLLRQSLRYCIQAEAGRRSDWEEHGRMLTSTIEEYHLMDQPILNKDPNDGVVAALAETLSTVPPLDAARAAASALAAGVSVRAVGESISLAATALVLRDPGRLPQWEDRAKPAGSVHGDSRGVHASDAANAWRNLALVMDGLSSISCLLIGAWQVARDRGNASDLLRDSLPAKHQIDRIGTSDPDLLLQKLDDAIVNNLQGAACAIAHRYGELDLPPDPMFQRLLQYAVSEDGALHAEKYFNTVWDDFHSTQPGLRWRHVASLARVTASEYGRPAAGQQEARELIARFE